MKKSTVKMWLKLLFPYYNWSVKKTITRKITIEADYTTDVFTIVINKTNVILSSSGSKKCLITSLEDNNNFQTIRECIIFTLTQIDNF